MESTSRHRRAGHAPGHSQVPVPVVAGARGDGASVTIRPHYIESLADTAQRRRSEALLDALGGRDVGGAGGTEPQ
jgi:hypothetical protein